MTMTPTTKLSKKHCLIVDDSDIIRQIASKLLITMNFETSQAENGTVALERCFQSMPDAILLDWQMPTMSSTEFLSVLRQQPNGDKPVIVYCTTENDANDIATAIAAGADDFLLKPFDQASLRSKLTDMNLLPAV
jgi:two-component system, chemotaxis family, chemotaxis protein CheY